jgi:hypothetical protein
MSLIRKHIASMLALSAALLGAAGTAHAGGDRYDGDAVYWSIAMAQPGLQVAVSNAPPMAAPVFVGYGALHVHRPPPVIVVPAPRVVMLPPAAPVYGWPYGRGWHHGHGHDHWHGHGYGRGH